MYFQVYSEDIDVRENVLLSSQRLSWICLWMSRSGVDMREMIEYSLDVIVEYLLT